MPVVHKSDYPVLKGKRIGRRYTPVVSEVRRALLTSVETGATMRISTTHMKVQHLRMQADKLNLSVVTTVKGGHIFFVAVPKRSR